MARRFPWVLAAVPWSEWQEYTRGRWDALPLLSWNIAPRDKLATRRQLRAMGLRPGGCDPVAVLYFRCRTACKLVFADLFLIATAKPVRPMTPARRAALDRAMAARRTCRRCGEDDGRELPRAHRLCDGCQYALGMFDPVDYRHAYLIGEPTLSAADHHRAVGNLTPLRTARTRPGAGVLACGQRAGAVIAA